MTDIVERLRNCSLTYAQVNLIDESSAIFSEAADEITRLRNTELKMAAKLIELRKANASLTSFIETELNQMRAELDQ